MWHVVIARLTLCKLTSLPAQRYCPPPPTHPGPILRASPLAPLAVRGTQGALTFLLLDTSWVVASGPDQTAQGRLGDDGSMDLGFWEAGRSRDAGDQSRSARPRPLLAGCSAG